MSHPQKTYGNLYIMRILIISVLGVSILLSVIFSPRAQAAYYAHPLLNHYQPKQSLSLAPEFSYYLTEVNYNRASNQIIPAELSSYARSQFDFSASYGLTYALTTFARLSWGRVDLKRLGGLKSSAYGFGDQATGLQYRIMDSESSGITFDLLGQVEFPLYQIKIATTDRTPFLGDASTDVTGAGFLQFPIDSASRRWWLINAGAGYTYRTNNFSAHVPWSVYLSYAGKQPGPTFHLGLHAITSLKTDIAGDQGGIPRSNGGTIAGGSNAVQATNPSLYTVKVGAGYMFTRSMGVQGYFSTSIAGTNSPKGSVFGAGLNWDFGGEDSARPNGQNYSKSNRGFVTYDFEASISKINDRLNLVKINKGKLEGVRVGQTFDIFQPGGDGKKEQAVARGKILDVLDDEAAVKILEYYKEVWIEEGFIARRSIQP